MRRDEPRISVETGRALRRLAVEVACQISPDPIILTIDEKFDVQ